MEQRVESFKYSVKIESSYFAAGTKSSHSFLLLLTETAFFYLIF